MKTNPTSFIGMTGMQSVCGGVKNTVSYLELAEHSTLSRVAEDSLPYGKETVQELLF